MATLYSFYQVIDITATFSKTIGNAIGRPPRPEYVFASLAVIVILSVFLEEQSVSFRDIVKYLDISL